MQRCAWVTSDETYIGYHDTEWGTPVRGDNAMFERMSLEGFQAGLSWLTILKRREGFREAFHGFDIAKVAKMTEKEVERLLQNEGIIRHRGKIEAVINNANRALEIPQGIEAFVREFQPQVDRRNLTKSPESEAMSKALRKLGFNFVGPTTMHALMQAIGMVEDHDEQCFRRKA